MRQGAAIELTDIAIMLGGQTIVSGLDLLIAAGEFLCLLGPSGCGKSTLLNVIAGFQPTLGQVRVDGKVVRGPGIDRGMVFQSTEALFPWLTVRQNVEYGPRVRGVARRQRGEAVQHYLDLVGLAAAADRFPAELSGGMRQRVQLARVLVNEPAVVLMDEPFAALDAQTREIMQRELTRIRHATGATIVFVTHDIWESILLADRVVTMTAGPRARIKTIDPVEIAGPRDPTDPDAAELYHRLRDGIAAEVGVALRQQGLVSEVEA